MKATKAPSGYADILSAKGGRFYSCRHERIDQPQLHRGELIRAAHGIDLGTGNDFCVQVIDATVQMYDAASVSAMVRVARRLSISRRTKPVLDMDTFLALRRRERSESPEGSIE
jgi:hypothetical protein